MAGGPCRLQLPISGDLTGQADHDLRVAAPDHPPAVAARPRRTVLPVCGCCSVVVAVTYAALCPTDASTQPLRHTPNRERAGHTCPPRQPESPRLRHT